ncbi:MAG: DUF11 domain-containing protein, partial [Burkholderiales bacterium]|nr:DUF11 domain-containing protein [Burkholderiales bacterium]
MTHGSGARVRAWFTRAVAGASLALVLAAPALAAVGINKSFTPNSVTAGQVSMLRIDLLNPNAAAATGVSVTDNLPANVVVANPLTIGANTCGFTVSATPGSGTIALSGGTIPPISGGVSGSCFITINVVSSVPNTYLNTIPASAVASSEGTNAQSAQATLVVSTPANVAASKAFSPTNVHGNGASETSVSTLTITLTNPNPIPLTGASVTDTLPVQLTIATPSNASTTCGAGTATASTPATSPATISLAGGTIPAGPGGVCTITVNVIARNPAAAFDNNVTNSVPAGALATAEGATSPAFNAPIRVQTGAALTKAFAPTSVAVGGSATLTITVRNFNQTTLSPITFTDTLPANLVLTGAPTTTCSGTLTSSAGPPASVTLTGASLGAAPAGVGAASCTITIPVSPTTSGTKTNNIAAGTWGGVAYSGTGNVNLAVSDITGSKSFSPGTVLQGGTTALTITLTNRDAAPVTINSPSGVTDNLATLGTGFSVPAGATVGGTCGSSITSALPATTLVFGGGTIPAGGSCTITISPVNVAANATTGTRTNTIAVNGVQTSGGNNTVTITGTLVVTRVLSAAKSWSPTQVQAGGVSRLTVTLTRAAGASALSGIAFTDLLTTMGGLGFVVANPANEATTCGGGTVTATPGATSFSLAGGSLAGGAAATSCTVSVNVQAPPGQAAGTYTNTLPAGAVASTEGFSNAAASAGLQVTNATSVTINKAFNPTTVAVGATSLMTIQIRNNNAGAIALSGVGLVDNLPPGMVIANPPAPSSTGCGAPAITAADNTATVTVANAAIAVSAICSINVTVRATAAGNLINTIPPNAVTSAQGVTNPLLGSATLAATGLVNLNVTKTNGQSSLTPGGTTTYTIGVTNSGPNDVAGVTVTDNPPPGVSFGAWTCVAAGGAVCGSGSGPISDIVTIPVGGSITYTVPASIAQSAPGPVANTVTLGVPGSVINTGNSSATDTDPLEPTLGKAIVPATIAVGGASTLTLLAGNNNNVPITLTAALVDAMPAGVTTTTANTGTCGGVSVTSTTITMASGEAIPAGGCTIVVGVTSSTPGTVTNTTSTLQTSTGTAPAASAPLTVTAAAPTLGKGIAPASIAAGGGATLTLTLGNPNAAPISLTSNFIDNMPPGVTTTSANTGTCTGVTVAAGSITMASGTAIPPGGCTIVVTVTSTTPGAVINTTGALDTTAGSAGPASAPLTVTLSAPSLSKSIVPATINAGGSATLTLTLGNPNVVAILLSSNFVDTMPPGVTTTSGNTGTCTGVTVAAGSITMASGTAIPPGGCTIVVAVTSSTPGTVTNTTGTLATSGGNAGPASAPLTVTAVAPTLGKSIVPSPIAAGGTATLTLTLGNANAAAITLAAPFADNMPAGVTTTSGNTGTCTGVTVAATSITMAAGSSVPAGGCTIVVSITSSTPGTVTNTTGTLSTNAGDAPPASADLTISALPTLAKAILPATIGIGGSATLTITVGNTNPAAITVTAPFTDPMPAGVTTTSGNTGTCTGVTVAAGSITLAAGTSIPSGGCTIVVTVTSATTGTVTNTTSDLATSAGTAPAAQAPLTVTAVSAALAKAIAPATIVAGGSTTLTITLSNANAIPITLSAPFTDTMPAGVTLLGGNTGTCAGVTNTATTITMAAGATVPVGGCAIVFQVTSATPGTVTNTTSALVTDVGTTPPASAPLTVTTAPPTLAKSIAPASISVGGAATLTLTLGNVNAVPLTLSSPFIDVMPAGVTTTSGNTGTCMGVTVMPTAITMAAGSSIPPGGCTIVVTITSSTLGTVTNTTGTLTTSSGSAPPASAPLTVSASPITLAKTIAPSTIAPGGTATLSITLGNTSGAAVTLTAPFTDTMPAGVTTTSGNTGTCTGVTVTSTAITMAAGSAIPPGGCTIIVTITSSTAGTVTNTTGPLTTGGGTAPPASAPLSVTSPGAPTLTKTIAPSTIAPGGAATLTLTLGNATAAPLTLTAAFVDTMPAGMTTTGGNTGTCAGVTVTSTTITMAAGSTIPPGGCTIVVGITSSTVGTLTNTTGPLTTVGGTAPAASAPITVTSAGVATLTKVIAPPAITPGGTATLTITLGNSGLVPLVLTQPFTDPMPAGMTITSGNTGMCTG